MKIGIISDIHSNDLALNVVFQEFEKLGVDKIICLGDFIGIGPHPEKCIDLLMKNRDKLLAIIRGNHERYLTEGITRGNHSDENDRPMKEDEIELCKWNQSRLSKEQIEFIKGLTESTQIEVCGKKILVEHYSMKNEKKYKSFIKIPNKEDFLELYNDKEADVYLFGHTHYEINMQINGKLYINPGALGCPEDESIAKAGLLSIENNIINYIQLKVPYNKQIIIDEINKLNYPRSQRIIKNFYGN